MKLVRWAIIIAGSTASIMVWAYSTFTTKDFSQLILDRLNSIENKLDHCKK